MDRDKAFTTLDVKGSPQREMVPSCMDPHKGKKSTEVGTLFKCNPVFSYSLNLFKM